MNLQKAAFDQSAADIRFGWFQDETLADDIARFFTENTGKSYISHTDIQWGRALSAECWSPSLHDNIALLAQKAAEHKKQNKTSAIWLATAIQGSNLAGIAFVTLRRDALTPYITLEDVIIKEPLRSHGTGSALINWVCGQCRNLGFRQVFLESAVGNIRAHILFHRHGFETLSVVMSRDL